MFKYSTAVFNKYQDMFRFSGIFCSVNLIAIPQVNVVDVHLPVVAADLHSGDLSIGLILQVTNDTTAQITVNNPRETVLDRTVTAEQHIQPICF